MLDCFCGDVQKQSSMARLYKGRKSGRASSTSTNSGGSRVCGCQSSMRSTAPGFSTLLPLRPFNDSRAFTGMP